MSILASWWWLSFWRFKVRVEQIFLGNLGIKVFCLRLFPVTATVVAIVLLLFFVIHWPFFLVGGRIFCQLF